MFPTEIEALGGVTAIDTNTGGVTVRLVVPIELPIEAETVEFPIVVPVASPVEEMVATERTEELHVTVLVKL